MNHGDIPSYLPFHQMFHVILHETLIGFIGKMNRKPILEHLLDSISLSN
jgi:hypothetical protein